MLPQYSRLGPDNTWIISVVNKITWFFSFLNNVWLWKLKFDLSRIINLNTVLADLQKNICWNRDMLHFLTFWVEGGYPPKVAIFFKMVGVIPPPILHFAENMFPLVDHTQEYIIAFSFQWKKQKMFIFSAFM